MRLILTISMLLLVYPALFAQPDGPTIQHNSRVVFRNGPTTLNPEWEPFYHGVASGDPLEDRVVIWTRVTPEIIDNSEVQVSWRVATDTRSTHVIKSGIYNTNAERDYTVKVDVTGLEPGKTYYYVFTAFGKNSLIGKTKTTPIGNQTTHLKFGVVSCSNYQAGYFTNYRHLAERNDLDAIIHLGDYIYEYADGAKGDSAIIAAHPLEPRNELVTLADYRARYSTYHLDTNLIRLHQQYPFITVWDDHESANNAYMGGAGNHNDSLDGSWAIRKAIAKQVYFEWMPIRDNSQEEVYRTIHYGNLMDLIMLDTRLEGREKQVLNIADSTLYDTARTILGAQQKAWLFHELSTSTTHWKIIGQQVMFSEFNIGWAAPALSGYTYESLESRFLDAWDGYPAERSQVINFIKKNEINNVVILTGDAHSSYAFDIVNNPVNITFQSLPILGSTPVYSTSSDYNPVTGAGSVAVEFVTPSITAANFVEQIGLAAAQQLQAQINTPIVPFPGINLGNPNPHMRYADLTQHGYYILDVKPDSVQANWYYSPILMPAQPEAFGAAYYTKSDTNHLEKANVPSAPKTIQDEPAPDQPLMTTAVHTRLEPRIFTILGVYPNPFKQINTLHYSLTQATQVHVGLYDINGKLVQMLVNQLMQPGIFTLQWNATNLPKGTYFYRIQVNHQLYSAKVLLIE